MSSVNLQEIALSRARRAWFRRQWRRLGLIFGYALIIIGIPFTLLPGHVGIVPLIIGLIIVLRGSRMARRRFIGLQRRHPRWIFPIRRLLRREPEVYPVVWQQVLRAERILPKSWRMARKLRRRWFGRARNPDSLRS